MDVVGPIFASVLALLPIFEEKAGIPIKIMSFPAEASISDIQDIKKNTVCETLKISDCSSLYGGYFSSNTYDGGNSEILSFSVDGAMREICLVYPNEYNRANNLNDGYYDGFLIDELKSLNTIVQMSECRYTAINSPNDFLKSQSHAVLFYQLLIGDSSFLMENSISAALSLAIDSNEAPVMYSNAVAQRILVEQYKLKANHYLNKSLSRTSRCFSSTVSRKDPLLEIPFFKSKKIDIVYDDGEEIDDTEKFPRLEILTECLFPRDNRSLAGHTIQIDDDIIVDLRESGSRIDNPEFYEDNFFKLYSDDGMQDLRKFTFDWQPFETFGGSAKKAFDYSWAVSERLAK
jgi:hypothetical protein